MTTTNTNRLVRQLLPKGLRNFKIGGFAEKVYTSISDCFDVFLTDLEDVRAVNYSATSKYNTTETANWERKLWIAEKGNEVELYIRKAIIERKHKESVYQGRNSAAYIQHVLNDSGFPDARVIENLFWDADESEFKGVNPYFTDVDVHFGDEDLTFNDSVFGHFGDIGITQVVANTILPEDGDQNIIFPLSETQLKSTFIITGASGELSIENILSIPQEKEREFRNLIMLSKPAHSLAFLNVEYTTGTDAVRYNLVYDNIIGSTEFTINNKAIMYMRVEQVSGSGMIRVSGNGQLYTNEIGYKRITDWAKVMNIEVIITGNLIVNVIFEVWDYNKI